MPAFSGSFSGTISAQSIVSVPDQTDHSLGLAEVTGTQRSTDPKWDDSAIKYWATTDVIGSRGIQRGYFVNEHRSEGLDRGTFEGQVSVAAGQPVVEGKWQYTGGEGSFAGITGGGTFKTKLTSPTTLEATWEGAYELASARAKAV
jgi:hypothetical protein